MSKGFSFLGLFLGAMIVFSNISSAEDFQKTLLCKTLPKHGSRVVVLSTDESNPQLFVADGIGSGVVGRVTCSSTETDIKCERDLDTGLSQHFIERLDLANFTYQSITIQTTPQTFKTSNRSSMTYYEGFVKDSLLSQMMSIRCVEVSSAGGIQSTFDKKPGRWTIADPFSQSADDMDQNESLLLDSEGRE